MRVATRVTLRHTARHGTGGVQVGKAASQGCQQPCAAVQHAIALADTALHLLDSDGAARPRAHAARAPLPSQG